MINAANYRNIFLGNGAGTVASYGFPVTDKTQLVVTQTVIATQISTTLTVDTDYTVQGVGTDPASGGCTITFSAAPASGIAIIITPNIALLQKRNFNNQGGFLPATHEAAFDQVTLMLQQQQEQIDRCVKLLVGNTAQTPDQLLAGINTQAAAAAASAVAAAASAAVVAQNPAYVCVNGVGTGGGQALSANVQTKVQYNNGYFGNHSSWFDATNFRFKPQIPGKYKIKFHVGAYSLTANANWAVAVMLNGSFTAGNFYSFMGGTTGNFTTDGDIIAVFNGTSDYAEIFLQSSAAVTLPINGTYNFLECTLISTV